MVLYLARNNTVSNLNNHQMNNVSKDSKNSNLPIDDACKYLREQLSYSFATIGVYRKFWKRISCFMEQSGYTDYTDSVGDKFLTFTLGGALPLQYIRYHKDVIRSVKFMNEFCQAKTITVYPELEDFSSNIGIAMESYLSYREQENRLSPQTLHGDRMYVSKFIHYLNAVGFTEIEQIDLKTIIHFLQSLDTGRRACRNSCIIRLRCMFRYWYEHNVISVNFASQMPSDAYRKQAKLPSVYTASEIGSMLDNIVRSCGQGKRDYAILMLLSRYGLRASDICRLKFENIWWEKNIIVVEQYKTGKTLELPLLKETGEAIIDYLKYGRQTSTLPNIFLMQKPPYGQMSAGTVYDAVNKAMRNAGVKPDRRRHGSHIFRHSLASLLLKEQTVLPVISEVLGHASCDSTKTYTRIDVDSMKKCMLEVPSVESSFYMQKGGYFYE